MLKEAAELIDGTSKPNKTRYWRLGLDYDGSTVSFFYNNGSDGWQRIDTTGPDTNGKMTTVNPGWRLPPQVFISGTPGGSGVTNFAVDKVEYTPVPEPTPMLLLGSGLLGLVGYRGKKFLRK